MTYIQSMWEKKLCIKSGGSVVDNMLNYQSRIARSISHYSGLSDETLNRGPFSLGPPCWWDVQPEFTHLLIAALFINI